MFWQAPQQRRLDGGRTARKTNIVFILTDDHGAWAMGCYGCGDVRTPNLDRLAAGGVRFTSAYACTPVCSPSRMTYMTGKLPCHHGVQDWLISDELREPDTPRYLDGQVTFSELLARSGYTLGHAGKWHMGDDEHAQAGFSDWACVPGGGGTYKDAVFTRNGKRVETRGFKDDFTADYSIEFIEQNRNRPFCLFTAFYSPHIPYDFQPEEDRAPYLNSTFPLPARRAHERLGHQRLQAATRGTQPEARLLRAGHGHGPERGPDGPPAG